MKFTVNTKPLLDALNLGVVDQNVSTFYQKSCLAQLSFNVNELTINLQAAQIKSEIHLKGAVTSKDYDQNSNYIIFVDCLLFKRLVSTFQSNLTEFEFTENGLILHSGKSEFMLPKMIDSNDIDLESPYDPGQNLGERIELNKDNWKFIKDHQMYSIGMSFVRPVYTRVWVGEHGDVLVGNFDESIFTHSCCNTLNDTCLLDPNIINMFNNLPETAMIYKYDKRYIVSIKNDSYEFYSEFTPYYEDDEDIGSYGSDIILDMMKVDSDQIKLDIKLMSSYLNQASLLASSDNYTITLTVSNNEIRLKDENVDCFIPMENKIDSDYSVTFKTKILKSVISNLDEESAFMQPIIQDGEVNGVLLHTSNMEVALAGVENGVS